MSQIRTIVKKYALTYHYYVDSAMAEQKLNDGLDEAEQAIKDYIAKEIIGELEIEEVVVIPPDVQARRFGNEIRNQLRTEQRQRLEKAE